MTDSMDYLSVYLHLANSAWKRLQMPDRDRFLVLAGVHAAEMKLDLISSYCRFLILKNNPGHMLRKWPSVASAVEDPDFLFFLKQILRRFPIEKAEIMLAELGIDRANERATYYSDSEYAASLLNVDPKWLEEMFGDSA